MVEFAMVVMAFFLVLFAAVSAAFHSIQRAMAETAAAAGVQLAASGTPGQPDRPLYGAAFNPTRDLLESVMFGTAIVQGADRQACQGMADAVRGGGITSTVMVCAYQDGNLVAERVVGRPAYVVPFLAQVLPWDIDVTVEMHQRPP